MSTRDFCEMVFNTAANKTRVVRIPDPIEAIGPTVVNNAAAQIINANPFDSTIGPLVDLRRADVVRIKRNVLIAPDA